MLNPAPRGMLPPADALAGGSEASRPASPTTIEFAFNASNRLLAACQFTARRWSHAQQLVVYCADASRLNQFDALLWSFDDLSFVPHVWAHDPLATQTPVLLTNTALSLPQAGLLLNLDDDCPPFFAQFQQVLEVVSLDPDDREAARLRWRHYQQAGHPIHRIDLSKPSP